MTWDYTSSGNRTAQNAVIGSPPSSSLAFDPATNRVNSTGWAHDASGNVTTTPDGSFSIDAAGRTIGHTPASGPALVFAFDATGLRTKRTEGASTTLYLRDGGQVIGEWNGTSWSKEYVWLGSTLLATIEGSTIKYHHQDHLSIRATTFADGMLGQEQGHYPFGEPWYETSPETTRIFTTYEREAGGSLDYAMFRWMGPEAGRFLSADPIPGSLADGQSWNRYAYAGNDPVNRWDPWGLQTTIFYEAHEVVSTPLGGGDRFTHQVPWDIYWLMMRSAQAERERQQAKPLGLGARVGRVTVTPRLIKQWYCMYIQAMLLLKDHKEISAHIVYKDGDFHVSRAGWKSLGGDRASFEGKRPSGTKGMAHTHVLDGPPSIYDPITRGRGDWGAAVEAGLPNFVVRRNSVDVVMPNAATPEIYTVLDGDWWDHADKEAPCD